MKDIPDEIINTLEYNLLMDLKKTDLNKQDRKILLTDYMARHGLSMGEVARSLGIPKTTLYYWIETEKKKEQTAKYDLKNKKSSLLEELDLIKHKLLIYKDRIKDRKFKIDDRGRKILIEIKDLLIWISYNTAIIKEKC